MNTSGDAAESIVRMSLQGLEVAVRLSGSGAKNIAALMIAILKDQKQTKGKTRLTNMLGSVKVLKSTLLKFLIENEGKDLSDINCIKKLDVSLLDKS